MTITKPTIGGDTNTWGNVLNVALDQLVADIAANATAIAAKAPIAGPTFTGTATVATLAIGADVNLYRSAANLLKTDDDLRVAKSGGGNVSITTAAAAGTIAAPLYATLDFLGWNDLVHGRIRVTDRSSEANGSQMQIWLHDTTTGATIERLAIDENGKFWINGRDTNLYRYAADTLATDDSFWVMRNVAGYNTRIINTNAAGDGLNILLGTATRQVLQTEISGDAQYRFQIDANGKMLWGTGALVGDTTMYRSAADTLATDDDLAINLAGKGLKIKEGANAKSGVSTLVGGTVTVANTSVTATSRIQLTAQSLGTVTAPKALAVTARTVGTSFVITSADATDTSPIAWHMVEPA